VDNPTPHFQKCVRMYFTTHTSTRILPRTKGTACDPRERTEG